MRARLQQIVVDSHDPARLVRFWAALLGGRPVDRELGWSHVEPPESPRMSFQPVPERKTLKNRLHLDVDVDDIEVAAARCEALGAARVGGTVVDESGAFQVMLDPEGNEFCLVVPPVSAPPPSTAPRRA